MRKLIILSILALVSLASCKTRTVIQYQTKDSIVYLSKTDSVNYYIKDSVLIYTKNDTVYNNKYVFKDRYKYKTDTINSYINKTEKVPYEVVKEKKVVPRWCWYLLLLNVVFVVFIVLKKWIDLKVKSIKGVL